MSTIYFTTPTQRVQVAGAERFHLMQEVIKLADMEGVGEGPRALPTVADLNAVLGRSDLATLVGRLTGQIELVVWTDGPNRAWLAGLIGQGRATGLLRADMGWEGAVQLLLDDSAAPVFLSCSQGEPFPNAEGWAGTAEQWEQLSEADRWAHAEGVLRAESEREDATGNLAAHPTLVAAPFSREFRPSNWNAFFFADSVEA